MSYASRAYRHRNIHSHDEGTKEPFSSRQGDVNRPARKGSFFQAKLAVNQPGDKYEREADNVANAVVNNRGAAPILRDNHTGGVQKLATAADDEKQVSTSDARMANDKEIQEKPLDSADQAKEKEKPAEVPTAKAPEEKDKAGIQKMDDTARDEEEKTPAAPVQAKNEAGSQAPAGLSAKLGNTSGKGQPLPAKTLGEMSHSFGTDFSGVRIHQDSEAAAFNKELQSQAFTHGNDIYFNEGRYDPGNRAGKFLLAHELAHVVQQGYAKEKKYIRRQPEDEVFHFDPFNEEEGETGTVADHPETGVNGDETGLGFLGDLVPAQLSPGAWNPELLGITLLSPNAPCVGNASPSRMIPMSLCNASAFCSGRFSFSLLFHFDADIIMRPPPFANAAVKVDIDFIPDTQQGKGFSKHASGTGVYAGPGVPLQVPFGNNFSFNSIGDGNLVVAATMADPSSGKTVSFSDTIRCTVIPCS